jgi:hypothetical protein
MAQSSSDSRTSSRRQVRDFNADAPGLPRYVDIEWESKEVRDLCFQIIY